MLGQGQLLGLTTLPLRFVLGWIYWGGGSRRFIYDPTKLNPDAHQWLANKLQAAMPGSLLMTSDVIQFLLQHAKLLYFSLVLFSLVELVSGFCLIIGFFTRTFAFITVILSILLMLVFGWEGGTCMDEWTMAISTIAMGVALMLSGSAIYSIDSMILKRHPILSESTQFHSLASSYTVPKKFKLFSNILTALVIIFMLFTYNYYRGAIYSRYHKGPTSSTFHTLALSDGKLTARGALTFKLLVNGGTTSVPSYIIRIELLDAERRTIDIWKMSELAKIPKSDITNLYQYNVITSNSSGLEAPLGASAIIHLQTKNIQRLAGKYELVLFTIEGEKFSLFIDAESVSTTGFA